MFGVTVCVTAYGTDCLTCDDDQCLTCGNSKVLDDETSSPACVGK